MKEDTINIPFTLLMNDGSKIDMEAHIDKEGWNNIPEYDLYCLDSIAKDTYGCVGFVFQYNSGCVFFEDGQWYRNLFLFLADGTRKTATILGYDSFDYAGEYIKDNKLDCQLSTSLESECVGLEYIDGKWVNRMFQLYIQKLFS